MMFKPTGLISILLVFFLVAACNQGSSSQRQPTESGSGGMVSSSDPMSMPPPLAAPAGGGVISGTITLDPSLAGKVTETNVVYIIARSADMPGPPVAVQQLRNIKFPYPYTLSSADLMMQGGNFQGKVNVVVRVDKDGAAGPPQPGDLEGAYSQNPATVGDQNVDIVINKAF